MTYIYMKPLYEIRLYIIYLIYIDKEWYFYLKWMDMFDYKLKFGANRNRILSIILTKLPYIREARK